MTAPATCAAKDPMTCRYHGTIQRMHNALAENDSDAYLNYKAKAEALEQQANPESFFAPGTEAEEIVSSKQLTNLINQHPGNDDQLDQTYAADFTLGRTYAREFGRRYRKFAQQRQMKFTEQRSRDGIKFVFTATTGRDLRLIRILLEDGEHHVEEDAIQARDIAAAATR